MLMGGVQLSRGPAGDLSPRSIPILAILTAFIVGSIFILITDFENLSKLGTDPVGAIGGALGGDRRRRMRAMLTGAFGDPDRIAAAISRPARPRAHRRPPSGRSRRRSSPRAPLIFCGLAVAISFRQRRVQHRRRRPVRPRCASARRSSRSSSRTCPAPVILLVATIGGVLTGALLGVHPGRPQGEDRRPRGHHDHHAQLRRGRRSSCSALRSDFLRQDGSSHRSRRCCDFVRRPADHPPARRSASTGASWWRSSWPAIVSWFLFKTTKGYELRASGFNMRAARYAGMSASGSIILAMTLSGGLAGLGGSMEVLGTVTQMSTDISTRRRLHRDRARAARRQPSAWHRARRAAVRRADQRRPPDGDQDRHSRRTCSSFIAALVIMFVAAPGLIRSLYRLNRDPDAQAVRRQPAAKSEGTTA